MNLPFDYEFKNIDENTRVFFEEVLPEFVPEETIIKDALKKYGIDSKKVKLITSDDCLDGNMEDFVYELSTVVEELNEYGTMSICSYNGKYYYAEYQEGLLSILWEF